MIICPSRLHCVACRTNPRFQQMLVTAKQVTSPDFACPFGLTAKMARASQLAPTPAPPALPDARIEKGRAAWKWLHGEALGNRLTIERLTTEFDSMIPTGCVCLLRWRTIRIKIPFRPADQFAWSVEAHNAVNTEMGKPVITVEQAKVNFEL